MTSCQCLLGGLWARRHGNNAPWFHKQPLSEAKGNWFLSGAKCPLLTAFFSSPCTIWCVGGQGGWKFTWRWLCRHTSSCQWELARSPIGVGGNFCIGSVCVLKLFPCLVQGGKTNGGKGLGNARIYWNIYFLSLLLRFVTAKKTKKHNILAIAKDGHKKPGQLENQAI